MEEPGKAPQIQVRQKAGEAEEEEKKGAGLIVPSGSAAANAPAAGAVSELGTAGVQQGGLIARLLSPLRSVVNFFRTAASLGFIEGTKFALRNVVVQGLLAGLAVAVIAGVFIGPGEEKGGKNSAGVFPAGSSKLAPEEMRGEGLYGAIPGIYAKVMAKLRGGSAVVPTPAPGESAAAGEGGEKAEEKKGDEAAAAEAAAAEEAAAKAKMAGSASPFLGGKLEKLASLFGSGSGGGAGGGGSTANLPVGAKGSSAAGGNQPKGGGAGKLDPMKSGRVKIPLRGGEKQAAFSGTGAKRQLKNAALAGQLTGKAADGQGAATMASLPFDGAKVPGGNVAETPGGGIGPWVPSGGTAGGGGQTSDLGGGDSTGPGTETPPGGPGDDYCPDDQIMDASGKCVNNPCGDNEIADANGKCTKLSDVTPYQKNLDDAATLIGQGQAKIAGAKKYLYIALALFAAAALYVLWPRGAKDKTKTPDADPVTLEKSARRAEDELKLAQGDPQKNLDRELIGGLMDRATEARFAADKAKKLMDAGSGSIMSRIGVAAVIAGIGFTLLNMYKSDTAEGKAQLEEAQRLASEVKSQYDQTDQAGRIKSATDTKCTEDGRPKIHDPAACGYDPHMTSKQLHEYVKCMTAPVCRKKS